MLVRYGLRGTCPNCGLETSCHRASGRKAYAGGLPRLPCLPDGRDELSGHLHATPVVVLSDLHLGAQRAERHLGEFTFKPNPRHRENLMFDLLVTVV
jgi:hypothetical protein